MESLMSRTTLYDMLAMIVPGFIALFSIVAIFLSFDGCAAYIKGIFTGGALAIPIYVCAFALSYLTGMLIHGFSDWFFKEILTNNPKFIQDAQNKFKDVLKERKEEETISYKSPMEEYYERYYVAMQYPLTKVPIMEAQVAFIRSMFFVVIFGIAVCVFYMCKMHIKGSALVLCLGLLVILLLVFILCYYHMIRIQKSIHYCIYEDSYYMKLIKGGWNEKTKMDVASLKRWEHQMKKKQPFKGMGNWNKEITTN